MLLGVWAFALVAVMITAMIVSYLLPPEELDSSRLGIMVSTASPVAPSSPFSVAVAMVTPSLLVGIYLERNGSERRRVTQKGRWYTRPARRRSSVG